ncbi:MAG: electron transport complex subunit RsxB [Gammaproteobacteria bacterium]|nr:electron transport complex subunit RsxB [Gammaproteobacteria bacterium]
MAIIPIFLLISFLSYGLLWLKKLYISNDDPIIDKINSYLPQTQCGQCSYPGCRPYATAISKSETDINRCPPGGQTTIDNLASLLNIPSKFLAEDLPITIENPIVAKINETECIGCLLCIKACPVDAIVGANKLMHTVITDQCTGCELCIAPCPMSCITMVDKSLPLKYFYK